MARGDRLLVRRDGVELDKESPVPARMFLQDAPGDLTIRMHWSGLVERLVFNRPAVW